jgi:hypothetical protein
MKKPLGIWIITIFYLIMLSILMVPNFLLLIGKITLTAEQKMIFENLKIIDYLTSFFGMTIVFISVFNAWVQRLKGMKSPIGIQLEAWSR